MNARRRCAFAAFAVFAQTAVAAVPSVDAVRFRNYGVDDGLSHNRVRAFAQDGQGYLWIATRDGLNRFDGVRFRVYRHDRDDPHSLPDNVVMTLATTRDGTLWIGTAGGGLARYDAARDRFERYRAGDATGLAGDQIRALHVDAAGALWVGSFGIGVQRFDPATGRASDLPFGRPEALAGVHGYVDLPGGGMLFAAGSNVWRWNGGDTIAPLLDTAGVRHPAERSTRGRDGDLWVALVAGGLLRFDADGRERRRYGAADGLGSDVVTSLLQSREGDLWIGTQLGVARYDRDADRFVAIRHDAGDRTTPPPESHALFEDADGLVWTGSGTSGIGVHDPDGEAVSVYRRRADGLPSSRVQAVTVEPDGTFWLGFGDAGVVRYAPERGVVERLDRKSGLASDAVAALARGRDGALWIGHVANGLDRLDANGGIRHYASVEGDPGSLPANLVNALAVDAAGTLWVASDGGGLASLCDGCDAFVRYADAGDDRFDFARATTTSLAIARDGAVWFGLFGGGVARLDPATRRIRRYAAAAGGAGPSNDVVRSLLADANGDLWIGSAGGLDRLDVAAMGEARFVAQRGEGWRGREHVVCLAAAAHDELWVGTTTGLVRYRPSDGAFALPAALGRIDRAGFAAGACDARDGKVYFGGVEGLIAFAPADLPPPRAPGPVVLTDFLLFNRPVDVRPDAADAPLTRAIAQTPLLRLDHRQNVFGFGFAALDYRDPAGVAYRYRLDGLNDDWIPVLPGRRDAVFSGVPAGRYRLRVQAERAGAAPRETTLEISIAPPPWRSPWAYAAYASIAVLAFGALWRRYERRLAYERSVAAQIRRSEEELRRMNEELESRVASRTSDLVAANETLSGTLERLRETQRQLVEAEKLASLGGLVAGVAHEINTPLGVCLTAASHLAEESRVTRERLARGELTRSQLDAYQNGASEAAEIIVRNLQRADRLVRGFKQTAVDQAVDEIGDVDLEQAVANALALIGPLLRGTPHRIVVDCAETVVVRAPPGALYQIVSNLVLNAVQHAFAQGETGTIAIAVARDGDGISLSVRDDGRGMDEAERSRVFEPFFTTRRGQGGTGLGLHVVYTLATQVLKGRIDCDSTRGRGTCFRVRWQAD